MFRSADHIRDAGQGVDRRLVVSLIMVHSNRAPFHHGLSLLLFDRGLEGKALAGAQSNPGRSAGYSRKCSRVSFAILPIW